MRVLILNGPNLNLLGSREPSIYGRISLESLIENLQERGQAMGIRVYHFQSNSEGALIDKIHWSLGNIDGIVFNPGALSHYSYALRDAIASISIPVIEVHISNISAREPFRNISVVAPACIGQISGLGVDGYGLALDYLAKHYINSQVGDENLR